VFLAVASFWFCFRISLKFESSDSLSIESRWETKVQALRACSCCLSLSSFELFKWLLFILLKKVVTIHFFVVETGKLPGLGLSGTWAECSYAGKKLRSNLIHQQENDTYHISIKNTFSITVIIHLYVFIKVHLRVVLIKKQFQILKSKLGVHCSPHLVLDVHISS
jgi:hypothetical protein